jgi:hypothetical protein
MQPPSFTRGSSFRHSALKLRVVPRVPSGRGPPRKVKKLKQGIAGGRISGGCGTRDGCGC